MTFQNEVLGDSSYVPLYKHGFVGLIDYMGNDEEICNSARVSYGQGTKSINDNRNLIRYLMRNKHTSPFEMGEIKFHIKLPIFVMRQWIRHRTANVNEYSGRYSEMTEEFYIPEPNYIKQQSLSNKQGRENSVSEERTTGFIERLAVNNSTCLDSYNLSLEHDISRELARIDLPLSIYTECYWKIDLHNLFHFLKLRMAENAQQEIRDYAKEIFKLTKEIFPASFEAFEDYSLYANNISRMETELLAKCIDKNLLNNELDNHGFSKREIMEIKNRWNINL